MNRTTICNLLRQHAHAKLSPTAAERTFVAAAYESIRVALPTYRCRQIGSYPRFTAVTPLHDLDIIVDLGESSRKPEPSKALDTIEQAIKLQYRPPLSHTYTVKRQTHSISIDLVLLGNVQLGIDIVPAYTYSCNEFNDTTFLVPEIALVRRIARERRYEEIKASRRDMQWIRTDPLGYISAATRLNGVNEDFRRTVKFVKAWKWAWRERDDDFPLKSFHIEQEIAAHFEQNSQLDIFSAIFNFYVALPSLITYPHIIDRADNSRFIDQYVTTITQPQRTLIREARDHFLIALEQVSDAASVASLLRADRRRRMHPSEAYLFDDGIPTLTEETISIRATALQREGSFREKVLSYSGLIKVDRHINFEVSGNQPDRSTLRWKVKNDDASREPRGEITPGKTKNNPEHTRYPGRHYVEVYAIRDGVCIARARQDVVLGDSAE